MTNKENVYANFNNMPMQLNQPSNETQFSKPNLREHNNISQQDQSEKLQINLNTSQGFTEPSEAVR